MEINKRQYKKEQNNKGQALIEYLILVAFMAVACIGVVRSINHVVLTKYAEIEYALRGQTKKVRKNPVNESLSKQRDLSNFMRGAGTKNEK